MLFNVHSGIFFFVDNINYLLFSKYLYIIDENDYIRG